LAWFGRRLPAQFGREIERLGRTPRAAGAQSADDQVRMVRAALVRPVPGALPLDYNPALRLISAAKHSS